MLKLNLKPIYIFNRYKAVNICTMQFIISNHEYNLHQQNYNYNNCSLVNVVYTHNFSYLQLYCKFFEITINFNYYYK